MISIIIFGGTGDLAKKKLFKSLYNLYSKNLLPKNTKIIGFARRDFNTDSYREFVSEQLPQNLELKSEFLECFYYFQGDLYTENSYHDLRKFLIDMDEAYKVCAFKLFYLSVRPELYGDVFTFLKKTDILHTCASDMSRPWSRILIEKPFGTNFEHAKELDNQLATVTNEEQIFRIDHYLAKEALENILIFRFKNSMFNAVWNKNFISKITIKLFEKRSVEGRGETMLSKCLQLC
jgi:glucose-6-phosphate 1-dehydrogenase